MWPSNRIFWKRHMVKLTLLVLILILMTLTFAIYMNLYLLTLTTSSVSMRYGVTVNKEEDMYYEVKTRRKINQSDSLDYFMYDIFESLLEKTVPRLNIIHGKVCSEKLNVVFIKTMKCATETIAFLIRRFGYVRHLNFVLPVHKNIYLGWPFQMKAADFRPSNRPYNILVDHAVYNFTIMQSLMPMNTVFITIIREPYNHFISFFNYFNVKNIANVTGDEPITEYLHNLDKYEHVYKSPEAAKTRYCIPNNFSITKNLLSHCLGMPTGFPMPNSNITGNENLVRKYVKHLDTKFTLVMIMEYFHESLILLKRLLCWSLKDILYHRRNYGNYSIPRSMKQQENIEIYKKWSSADYILYDYFNKTFWRKVRDEAPDFFHEVKYFTKVQKEVSHFCDSLRLENPEDIKEKRDTVFKVSGSRFNEPFQVTADFCLLMQSDMFHYLRERFDKKEPWALEEINRRKEKSQGC
ncbi:hypothetical protein CHS0354_017500 [Potamilus streckersoni]|uniref:Uncharacterized protein n=1 Tax=Potamilus streckersoni TaxID=2493646 RepID=A0AAE0TJV1_9BIVA|nr:hypothetical protein CHS0354_017500 [Potamilus streckersoni]